MEVIETGIEGLIEIVPKIFQDERGYFLESYQKQFFKSINIDDDFVQDNQSFSKKGVLRGLHFQKAPYEQSKLVKVIQGKVLDVAVDLRKNSPTFGEHRSVILDAKKQNMFYVPRGFAHGFLTLEDAIFVYKCDNYYNKSSESGILWSDKTLNINWGIKNPIVSEKDQILPCLKENNTATFIQ